MAIAGTEDLDISEIDPTSNTLAGVPPLFYRSVDVITPFEPFVGKEDCRKCGVPTVAGALKDGTEIVGEDVVKILKRHSI